MQGELVGDFLETDVFIYSMSLFSIFSKSLNSFELRRIFPETSFNFASNGLGPMSVYKLQPRVHDEAKSQFDIKKS